MKKAILGLSAMLLASGLALAIDYSKLSNQEIIEALKNDNIAKNEQEKLKEARKIYKNEKELFFNEFEKRIKNASKKDKKALKTAFNEYKNKINVEINNITPSKTKEN